MALPSSGQLSLSDIQGEFGGSAPISLSEYYDAASGVPASGEITVSDFYGKANAVYMAASGGSSTVDIGDFRYHSFFGSGTFTITTVGNSAGSNTVDYMIVAGAGGGGGGFRGTAGGIAGGAGGAGGMITATGVSLSAQAYSIVVAGDRKSVV